MVSSERSTKIVLSFIAEMKSLATVVFFLQIATGEKDELVVIDEDLFERFLGSIK